MCVCVCVCVCVCARARARVVFCFIYFTQIALIGLYSTSVYNIVFRLSCIM